MRPPPTIGVDDETAPTHFPTRWINREEARRLVVRCERTIYSWEQAGLIIRRSRGGIPVYEAGQLLRAKDESTARAKLSRFHPGHQRTTGVGRPPHQARPKIARMIGEGFTNSEIHRECECSETLIKAVRRELRTADAQATQH